MPPVEEHAVHEKVRQKEGARYGCHNKPRRRDDYFVKTGHDATKTHFDGDVTTRQRRSLIPDFGSLECRYDMSLTDDKCEGCEHRGSGEAYDKKILEVGK